MSESIDIKEAKSGRDLRAFVDFPYRLLRGSNWVPPLRRDQRRLLNPRSNPFFEHGTITPFLAIDSQGVVVGRIAAIRNGNFRATHEQDVGFFGFFDCVNDERLAARLFDTVAQHFVGSGLKTLIGPTNPSTNETSGILVDGFDRPPAIMLPFNPPYYQDLLLNADFHRVRTLYTYYASWKHLDRERLLRAGTIVKARNPGVEVRPGSMDHFDREASIMHRVYNQAFATTWGFVPMTTSEFNHAASGMRKIMDPRLVFFLEMAGDPIGFALALPDVNQILGVLKDGRLTPFGLARLMIKSRFHDINEFRTVLIAVLPEFRGRGFDALLVHHLIEAGREAGYVASTLGWVMEDNDVLLNSLRKLGAVQNSEYALFKRDL